MKNRGRRADSRPKVLSKSTFDDKLAVKTGIVWLGWPEQTQHFRFLKVAPEMAPGVRFSPRK